MISEVSLTVYVNAVAITTSKSYDLADGTKGIMTAIGEAHREMEKLFYGENVAVFPKRPIRDNPQA